MWWNTPSHGRNCRSSDDSKTLQIVREIARETATIDPPLTDNMTDRSSVHVHRDLLDDLDDAAEALFDTNEVPHRATIERLLADHDAVEFDKA
jgi:hypothetical protein